MPVAGAWKVLDPTGKVVGGDLGDWLKKSATRSFVGTLDYETEVTLHSETGRRYFLDAGTVGDFAELWVNRQRIGVRLWAPFRWDISKALQDGKNAIKLAVTNSRVNQFGKTQRPSGLLGPVRILSRGAP